VAWLEDCRALSGILNQSGIELLMKKSWIGTRRNNTFKFGLRLTNRDSLLTSSRFSSVYWWVVSTEGD
jgi:hypothetical protein